MDHPVKNKINLEYDCQHSILFFLITFFPVLTNKGAIEL